MQRWAAIATITLDRIITRYCRNDLGLHLVTGAQYAQNEQKQEILFIYNGYTHNGILFLHATNSHYL